MKVLGYSDNKNSIKTNIQTIDDDLNPKTINMNITPVKNYTYTCSSITSSSSEDK